ncbi:MULTISPECIES: hypothetical protein [Novosphingobium]|uniref:Uncharacterized protein n=1 Tax=Novosphingobium mangrovi (ex Hu et al. 2023) TaxID=2930094 RepID=A0ABT0AAK3_9SPHN|nr:MULTISPECIES: hypothetical protein [Novosphingobium]MCJ1960230.1 hypothetical protein [Novosphingobium mangrovi (ex Hu et al. 2023)]
MRIQTIVLIGIYSSALLVAGYGLGNFEGSRHSAPSPLKVLEYPAERWIGTDEQVQDAVERWARKTTASNAEILQHRKPRSMFIPTRNQGSGMLCIELELERGALGGSPVYCYENQTTKLVAEYSDVE